MAAKKKNRTAAIPKDELDKLLYYLFTQQMKPANLFLSSSQTRHPHYLFQYYKAFRFTKRLKDTALCLLKTQFSKFPVDHGPG